MPLASTYYCHFVFSQIPGKGEIATCLVLGRDDDHKLFQVVSLQNKDEILDGLMISETFFENIRSGMIKAAEELRNGG